MNEKDIIPKSSDNDDDSLNTDTGIMDAADDDSINDKTDVSAEQDSADSTESNTNTDHEADSTSTADNDINDDINDDINKDSNKSRGRQKKRSKKRRVVLGVLLSFLVLLLTLYLLFAYAPFKPFSSLRRLFVETAMTTGDHQYLVNILPKSSVDKAYTQANYNIDVIGGLSNLPTKEEYTETESTDVTEPDVTTGTDTDIPTVPEEPEIVDILGQADLTVGEPDYAGYIVSVNDIEQGLVVSDIEDKGEFGIYRGKIMLIDDPSRVYLGTTPYKHQEGLRIKAMMEYHGAIAGINASGFNDPNDSGHGGDVIGLTCSQGEFWGTAVSYYGSVLITENDKLVVGNVRDWQNYAIRDGIQFGPVLIADGVAQFSDSAGFGLHPRTAIGQREDGVIVFLIIDGRRIGWSNGCTVKDMIDVLQKYGVVNAACCDGGSSSVLAYNGEVITKNSSKNPSYGRRLPNAWLVRPKTTETDESENTDE